MHGIGCVPGRRFVIWKIINTFVRIILFFLTVMRRTESGTGTRMEGKPKGGISRLAPHLSDVSPRHS